MQPLRNETSYVIVNKMSRQPFCTNKTIYIYSDKDLANQSLTTDSMMIQVVEPEKFNNMLINWYVMGFEKLVVDNQKTITIAQIEGFESRQNFGYFNAQLCQVLLEHKDFHASKIAQIHDEGKNDFSDEVKIQLANHSVYTNLFLLQSPLCLPCDPQDATHAPVVPKIKFNTGEEMVGVFTDHQAILRYYNQEKKDSVAMKELLIKEYRNTVLSNEECDGIVINPGREEYILRRPQLEKLNEMAKLYDDFNEAKKLLHTYQQENKKTANAVKASVVLGASRACGKALTALPAWFVAFHPAAQGRYPLFGTDGSMELFTNEVHANEARLHFKKNELVDFQIKRIGQGNAMNFIAQMMHLGVTKLRVDNGDFVVDLMMSDVASMMEKEMVSQMTQQLRFQMIRAKQYQQRAVALANDKEHRNVFEILNQFSYTARLNSYRELYHNPIYVLGVPDDSEATRYTPKAYQLAKAYMDAHQITDESYLQCPKDIGHSVYDGVLSFAFVNRQGKDGTNTGYVCAFSEGKYAKEMLETFRSQGLEVDVLVVTFGELLGQAQQCAGIVIDPLTIDFLYEKSEYQNMERFGKSDQPLVARINKKVS